jgi:hypothetical protein
MGAMSARVAGDKAAPAGPARLPWALLIVTVVLVVVMVPLSLGREPYLDTVFYGVLVLALATLGAFIATRQPANPIGWIFCALGAWGGVVETWEAFPYHALPTSEVGEWIVGWSWVLDMSAYALVFLLFPTGRLLTPRWRFVVWLLAAGCVLGVPGQALNPDNPANPLPVDSVVIDVMFGLGMLLVLFALIAAVASVWIRYRRAAGVERLQLRQLVVAGSVVLPIMGLAIPFYYDSAAVQAAVGLAFLALPVAAGLAILRYRLYDIDVVINRALVYGALTATLAAAYIASVLLLQLALSGFTEGSSLAVAASTLAVAALFRPARSRIQAAVDKRFFRRKYDAVRTLEAFGARLRAEVDLASLEGDLRAVVAGTMQPAHVSLWLREGSA